MSTMVCYNCGNEVVGEIVSEEWDSWTEFPDTCPHCTEELDTSAHYHYREDFHADL